MAHHNNNDSLNNVDRIKKEKKKLRDCLQLTNYFEIKKLEFLSRSIAIPPPSAFRFPLLLPSGRKTYLISSVRISRFDLADWMVPSAIVAIKISVSFINAWFVRNR